MERSLNASQKNETERSGPADSEDGIHERHEFGLKPRVPLRAQMVTMVKLLAASSGVGLVLWLLDQMVSG